MQILKYVHLKLKSTNHWTVIVSYDDGTSDNLGEIPKANLNICGSFLTVWENADSVYFHPKSKNHKLIVYQCFISKTLSILDSQPDLSSERRKLTDYSQRLAILAHDKLMRD